MLVGIQSWYSLTYIFLGEAYMSMKNNKKLLVSKRLDRTIRSRFAGGEENDPGDRFQAENAPAGALACLTARCAFGFAMGRARGLFLPDSVSRPCLRAEARFLTFRAPLFI